MKMEEVMAFVAKILHDPDTVEIYVGDTNPTIDSTSVGFCIGQGVLDSDPDCGGWVEGCRFVIDHVDEMDINDARGVVEQFIHLHEWASKLWPPRRPWPPRRWMTQDEIDDLPF